jgi:hypothetical protein
MMNVPAEFGDEKCGIQFKQGCFRFYKDYRRNGDLVSQFSGMSAIIPSDTYEFQFLINLVKMQK